MGNNPDGVREAFLAFLETTVGGASALGAGLDVAASFFDGSDGALDITLGDTGGGTLSVDYSVVSRLSVVDFETIGNLLGPDTTSGVQLWDIAYDGTLDAPASLVFHYDDSAFTEEEEQSLFMYHRVGGEWVQENGVVDTVANTLEIQVGSFSPFALAGVPGTVPQSIVPQPGTGLLVMTGLLGLAFYRRDYGGGPNQA